jgi:hypothetical protein
MTSGKQLGAAELEFTHGGDGMIAVTQLVKLALERREV